MADRIVFTGRVTQRRWCPDRHGQLAWHLVAGDPATLAAHVSALNARGQPIVAIHRPPGDPLYDPLWYGRPVAEALTDLLDRHREALAAWGAAPDRGPAYRPAELAALPAVPATVVAINRGLPWTLRRLIDDLTGVAHWFDPATRHWRFVARSAAPMVTVSLGEGTSPAAALCLRQRLAPPPAAVEVFGDEPDHLAAIRPAPLPTDDATLPHADVGPTRREQWRRVSDGQLRPDWSASLQSTWSRLRAALPDPSLAWSPIAPATREAPALSATSPEETANQSDNPYRHVYRRWRLEDRPPHPAPDGHTPMRLLRRIGPPNMPPRWQTVSARWCPTTSRLIATEPVIDSGDPDTPGQAVGPADMAAVFTVTQTARPLLRLPGAGAGQPGLPRLVRRVYVPGLTVANRASQVARLSRRWTRPRPNAAAVVSGHLRLTGPDALAADLWEPARRLRIIPPHCWGLPVVEAVAISARLDFGPPWQWRVHLG